jgi:hypothetical protein
LHLEAATFLILKSVLWDVMVPNYLNLIRVEDADLKLDSVSLVKLVWSPGRQLLSDNIGFKELIRVTSKSATNRCFMHDLIITEL